MASSVRISKQLAAENVEKQKGSINAAAVTYA
jgi:hypothetical protein